MKTLKQINKFNKDGYIIIRDVIDSKIIKEIFFEISEVLEISLNNLNVPNVNKKSVEKKFEMLKNLNPVLKSHCYDIIGKLNSVRKITINKKILDFIQNFLRTSLAIQSVQVRIDDSSNERILPMHQELEMMSLMTLTTWIPLTNTNKIKGGIRVIPGSHKLGLLKHIDRKKTNSTYNRVILDKKNKIKELQIKKGDALIFHPLLVHGSVPNNQKKTRWTIVFRWSDLKHMPYLKNENASIRMSRNPNEKEPGCEFIKNFIKNESN